MRTVGHVKAVDDIDMRIEEGETLGLVGESGCGKTTVGRVILGLIPSTAGSIQFYSSKLSEQTELRKVVDITTASSKTLKSLRCEMQIIFQDPYSSLNPRMTVEAFVGEPMLVHGTARGAERRDRIIELMRAVGLKSDYLRRYPHEFSGGQRQRIMIARALALEPRFLVADEPVSALDVSIQAQVINLLEELQEKFRLTYLFISHDLSVVKHISNRIAVMYLGRIVELAVTETLFTSPKHPYTEALMSAIPITDPDSKIKRISLKGDIPSSICPPSGCVFHTRCSYVKETCKVVVPDYRRVNNNHFVRCHFSEKLSLRSIYEE